MPSRQKILIGAGVAALLLAALPFGGHLLLLAAPLWLPVLGLVYLGLFQSNPRWPAWIASALSAATLVVGLLYLFWVAPGLEYMASSEAARDHTPWVRLDWVGAFNLGVAAALALRAWQLHRRNLAAGPNAFDDDRPEPISST
jgi:hypothetical protein